MTHLWTFMLFNGGGCPQIFQLIQLLKKLNLVLLGKASAGCGRSGPS